MKYSAHKSYINTDSTNVREYGIISASIYKWTTMSLDSIDCDDDNDMIQLEEDIKDYDDCREYDDNHSCKRFRTGTTMTTATICNSSSRDRGRNNSIFRTNMTQEIVISCY
jgi:hypothetical protein